MSGKQRLLLPEVLDFQPKPSKAAGPNLDFEIAAKQINFENKPFVQLVLAINEHESIDSDVLPAKLRERR